MNRNRKARREEAVFGPDPGRPRDAKGHVILTAEERKAAIKAMQEELSDPVTGLEAILKNFL